MFGPHATEMFAIFFLILALPIFITVVSIFGIILFSVQERLKKHFLNI